MCEYRCFQDATQQRSTPKKCPLCKGTGSNPQEPGPCPSCMGSGVARNG